LTILESTLAELESEVRKQQMKLSYKEYILREAKQVGNIYHFTPLSRIESIIRDKKITKGKQGYVSLTRDFQLPNDDNYFDSKEYIVRLTIDGNKLSENTKIIPHQDREFPDEREEGVLTSVKLKYIKRIDIILDYRLFSETAINAVYEVIKNQFPETYKVKKWLPVKF